MTFLTYLRMGAMADRPAIMDIGFSADEATRMANAQDVLYIYKNYPLVFDGIGRHGCERIIEQHGWPRTPKSACDFCMFRGPRHFKKMAYENPERFEQIMALEERAMERAPYTLIEGITLRKLRDEHADNLDAYGNEGSCTDACSN